MQEETHSKVYVLDKRPLRVEVKSSWTGRLPALAHSRWRSENVRDSCIDSAKQRGRGRGVDEAEEWTESDR